MISLIRSDEGSASVAGIGVGSIIVFVAGAIISTHSLFLTHREVTAAADSAALAAADAAAGYVAGVPCDLAAHIAERNRATIDNCTVEGLEALVSVSRQAMGITIRVSARAGPPTHIQAK